MTWLRKLAVCPLALVGGLVGLALLATTAVPLFAQSGDEAPGRGRMEQMMGAMHEEGMSSGMQEMMKEMMGTDPQAMMEQCMAMMSMMMGMMQGSQDSSSMQEMMPGVMGR